MNPREQQIIQQQSSSAQLQKNAGYLKQRTYCLGDEHQQAYSSDQQSLHKSVTMDAPPQHYMVQAMPYLDTNQMKTKPQLLDPQAHLLPPHIQ